MEAHESSDLFAELGVTAASAEAVEREVIHQVRVAERCPTAAVRLPARSGEL